MMTLSSFIVPAGGVLTAPILARALGTVGRGELAAALAPAALILPVATLGLPDALTNLLAKHPRVTRRALGWATLVTTGLGALCLIAALIALPFLSAGNSRLAHLIVFSTAMTIPALVVGPFRGAAVGRQMWGFVAVERVINALLRIIVLGVLWMLGDLTVFIALLVSCVTPLIAALVYWRLLRRPAKDDAEEPFYGPTLRPLVSFGAKIWFGAVAEMLLGRIGQVLMTPLSSTQDLGLYIVACTISDVLLVVAVSIQGALYGLNSRENDASRVTATSRLTVIVGLAAGVLIGGTLPWWITPVFGAEFDGAVVPTIMLLVSALFCIPGLMAAAGLSAWKRPALRSIGLVLSLVVNISVFVLLVPKLGVIGACWTSVITNVVMTGFLVTVASRIMKVPAVDFLVPKRADFELLWREGGQLLSHARSRLPGRRA